MRYRVKILPSPTVVDPDGNLVPEARVLEISFAGASIAARVGGSNFITDAKAATIMVGRTTVGGVSLC